MEGKFTVLLVENEYFIAHSEKKLLEEFGYRVLLAFSGEMAIESVNSGININIILMDIDLGKGLNGIQTAEIILEKSHIPALFLTSFTDLETIRSMSKTPAYGFISKNCDPYDLDKMLKQTVSDYHVRTENKPVSPAVKVSDMLGQKTGTDRGGFIADDSHDSGYYARPEK